MGNRRTNLAWLLIAACLFLTALASGEPVGDWAIGVGGWLPAGAAVLVGAKLDVLHRAVLVFATILCVVLALGVWQGRPLFDSLAFGAMLAALGFGASTVLASVREQAAQRR
jgi:hypothetical protein